jgi:hypothetical protein
VVETAAAIDFIRRSLSQLFIIKINLRRSRCLGPQVEAREAGCEELDNDQEDERYEEGPSEAGESACELPSVSYC